MKNKSIVIVAATVLICAGVALFANTFVHAVYYDMSQQEASVTGRPPVVATSSIPLQLTIPKINVDAKITGVGVTTTGNMAAPHNLTDVGWYKYGTAPGDSGTAVIDGHVDNALTLPGVFKHLKELQPGDDIYVKNTAGDTLHFIVSDVQVYYYKDVPVDLLFNKTGGKYLNLITCDGTWVTTDKTADHRVVVYTELKS